MRQEIFYDVHSDENEDSLFMSFSGRGAKQAAISYAREHCDKKTYVDRVVHCTSCDKWEYECVWSYNWEE